MYIVSKCPYMYIINPIITVCLKIVALFHLLGDQTTQLHTQKNPINSADFNQMIKSYISFSQFLSVAALKKKVFSSDQ